MFPMRIWILGSNTRRVEADPLVAAEKRYLGEDTNRRRNGQWLGRLRRFWRPWDARIGSLVLILLLVVCLTPSDSWPARTYQINPALRLIPPTLAPGQGENVLGTDVLGRDLLFRILSGARLTWLISSTAVLLSTLTGVTVGLVTGYFRGWTDTITQRFVDIMQAFPILLLVLTLVASVGRSQWALIAVLSISGWAGYTRIIRSSILSLVEREFVEAARVIGASSGRIIRKHLLPNILSPILVLSTFNLAQFVLLESAISFLGLGPSPPSFTWGSLIGDGRDYIFEAWWLTAIPGIAIFVTVLALNMVGDAMRDAFDPRERLS